MSSVSVLFETLGCRLNQIESESAARFFSDAGYSVIMEPLTASSPVQNETLLCVVNTCAVTQKAEQKARREIRLLLEKCPHATVIVTGCYAQLRGGEIGSLSGRIAVLPGQCKSRLADVPALVSGICASGAFSPELCAQTLTGQLFGRPAEKAGVPEQSFRLSTDTFFAHSRSSLKIQDGCNNACSYCTIHTARGKSVSLAVQDVVDRVAALEQAGQQEVVFTTVNIAQYRGAYGDSFLDFAGLLALLLQKTSSINFRISSVYPEIVDDRFCSVIRDARVRPHFHLSVQSGSDKILAAMNRPYTSAVVRRAVDRIRQAKSDPFFACDIITGFPGETAADFEQTMDLVRSCNFAWVHAFPFSARPGTPACTLTPKIPQSAAGERVARLIAYSVESKTAYISRYCGKTVRAIAETVRDRPVPGTGKSVHAVTENFIHCDIPLGSGAVPRPGSDLQVRIIRPFPDRIAAGGEQEAEAEIV